MANYTFTKDKNYYIFTSNIDGSVRKFDVNTKTWIGVKGNPVKIGLNNREVRESLPRLFNECVSLKDIPEKQLMLYDRLLSLGYGDITLHIHYSCDRENIINTINENFSKFIQYIEENKVLYNNHIWGYKFTNDLLQQKYAKIFNERVNPACVSLECFCNTIERYSHIKNNIELYIHYLNKNFKSIVTEHQINDYFAKCELLGRKPEKGDFLKNYSAVIMEYEAKKDEFLNKKIKQQQTEKNYGGFKYNDVIVEIPTSIDDFTRLGQEFNNCLGGWELHNRIETGEYCVAILRGSDWKVAIDFTRDGGSHVLDQCYAPHNRSVGSDIKDIARLYIDYINSL